MGRKKCQHGRRKRYCEDCGGKKYVRSKCSHGREPCYCEEGDCTGKTRVRKKQVFKMCQHGRRSTRCEEGDCTGKKRVWTICPHGRQARTCREAPCKGKKQVPKKCSHGSVGSKCRTCFPQLFLDGGAGKSLYMLKYDFGMTPTDYYFIRCLQNNICPVCDELLVSGIGNIDIDHKHGTDIVRGLLHPTCNRNALGYYEDQGRTDNPKFEEYKQRNPLERQPYNNPVLVRNDGGVEFEDEL